MPTAEKIATVEDLAATLAEAKGVYLTDFSALTVAQISELRRKCRNGQIEYRVVKRTLLQRAARERGLAPLDQGLTGPCGLVTSKTDELSPARILTDFAKANEKFRVRLAVIDGRMIPEQQVKTLATLPDRQVLQAQLLGALNAPAAALVGVLQAPLTALLSVLSQQAEKAGGGEKTEAPATAETPAATATTEEAAPASA